MRKLCQKTAKRENEPSPLILERCGFPKQKTHTKKHLAAASSMPLYLAMVSPLGLYEQVCVQMTNNSRGNREAVNFKQKMLQKSMVVCTSVCTTVHTNASKQTAYSSQKSAKCMYRCMYKCVYK